MSSQVMSVWWIASLAVTPSLCGVLGNTPCTALIELNKPKERRDWPQWFDISVFVFVFSIFHFSA